MGFFDKPETIGPGSVSDADRSRIADLEMRVARLEGHVAQLAQSVGGAPGAPFAAAAEPWMVEVQELKRSGKVINAIKLYRERTGVGLKEAKDAVDAMSG